MIFKNLEENELLCLKVIRMNLQNIMDIERKSDLTQLSINSNSKFENRFSEKEAFCLIDYNGVELIDVIDDISICSFFSLDNLKEYAKSNGILEYEKVSCDIKKCNKSHVITDEKVQFFDTEAKSSYKYNTRSRNLRVNSSKTIDINQESDKIIIEDKTELLSYDYQVNIDINNDLKEKNDHFLKKLDDILIPTDKKCNNFYQSQDFSYDEDLMIWQPTVRNNDFESQFKVNRSISTCSTSSSSTNYSIKKLPLIVNECGKDHCRLGCICDSLTNYNINNSINKIIVSNEKQNSSNFNSFCNKVNISNLINNGNCGIFRDHCGRIECMFECSCLRRLRSATRSKNDQNSTEKGIANNSNRKNFKVNIKNNNPKNFNICNKKTERSFNQRQILPKSKKQNQTDLPKSKYLLLSSSDSSRNSTSSFHEDDSSINHQNSENMELRKSKRVRYLKNIHKLSRNSHKIDHNFKNKFKDCYYYYSDNNASCEKDKTKSKNLLNKIADKNNKFDSKLKDHKLLITNSIRKNDTISKETYDSITLLSKNTYLNKEILSLIKLNSSINYDRNNKKRKTRHRSHDETIEKLDRQSNENFQNFDYEITVFKSNNQQKVNCYEFKNNISKLKFSLNEPFEKNILININSQHSENLKFPIYLKVSATDFNTNNLTFIDPIFYLVSMLLKKLIRLNKLKIQRSWKELEFTYEKKFSITIKSSVDNCKQIIEESNQAIYVHIKTYKNSNGSDLNKLYENLNNDEKMFFDELDNLIKSLTSEKSTLTYLLMKKKHIIQQSEFDKHEEKSSKKNLILFEKMEFPQNLKNKFQKHQQTSNLIIDQTNILNHKNQTNFEEKELNFLESHKNYISSNNIKFIPRLLKRQYKSIQQDSNLEIKNFTRNKINKTISTQLNLKNIDIILKTIKNFPTVPSNHSFIKLLSLCNINNLNKRELIKKDDFENISDHILNFRQNTTKNEYSFSYLNSQAKELSYFPDELDFFRSKVCLKKKFKYPFYDPFTDKTLITSMYNQYNSRKLIDDVCETLNDVISVVSLFSNKNYNNDIQKVSSIEPVKKIIPLTLVSNDEKIANNLSKRNIVLKKISIQNQNIIKCCEKSNVINEVENSQNLSNIDQIASALNVKEVKISNNYNIKSNEECLKNKILSRNLTPRILIRPKAIETQNTKINDISIKNNPKLNFIPIRPRVVNDYHLDNLSESVKSEKIDNYFAIENVGDRRYKRKQDLKSKNIHSEKYALNDKEELLELNESKKYMKTEVEPKRNDFFISSSSLFKPKIQSNAHDYLQKNGYNPNFDNSSDSLEFNELNAENFIKKNNYDIQRESNCSTSGSSFSNKNSFSINDQDDHDIDQESNFSLSKKSESSSEDDNDDQINNTSMSESNSFNKLKRPVSNTIHSIKERQRRLSLKKSFNKLKVELFIAIANTCSDSQSKLELKESFEKTIPKSKQKILIEVIYF